MQFFDPHANPKFMDRLGEWSQNNGGKVNATIGHGRIIPGGAGNNRATSFDNFRAIISGYEEVAPHDRIVRSAWARDMLRGGIAGARIRGRKRRPKLDDQFSIVDPPDRDTPKSQAAKAKDSAADTANAFSAEMRRRLDKLSKKTADHAG